MRATILFCLELLAVLAICGVALYVCFSAFPFEY